MPFHGRSWKIAHAVPPGTSRTKLQMGWLKVALSAIAAQGWYANREHNYTEVCRVLALEMDWDDKTTRPTHRRLAELAGAATTKDGRPISERTVSRVIAWLKQMRLIGVVTPGTTPRWRPGGGPMALEINLGDNEAAEYVLVIPHEFKRQLSASRGGTKEFVYPSGFACKKELDPRARETEPAPSTPWRITERPKTRSDEMAAAEVLRSRSRPLSRLSPQHVAAIARPYIRAGWTPSDVLNGLDHVPSGRLWPHSHAVRHPAAWARYRLNAWHQPDGSIAPSPSQVADASYLAAVARQAGLKAEAAAVAANAASPETSREYAARARAQLGASSETAARNIARDRARLQASASRPAPAPRAQVRVLRPAAPAAAPAAEPDSLAELAALMLREPDPQVRARARVAAFERWVARRRGGGPADDHAG